MQVESAAPIEATALDACSAAALTLASGQPLAAAAPAICSRDPLRTEFQDTAATNESTSPHTEQHARCKKQNGSVLRWCAIARTKQMRAPHLRHQYGARDATPACDARLWDAAVVLHRHVLHAPALPLCYLFCQPKVQAVAGVIQDDEQTARTAGRTGGAHGSLDGVGGRRCKDAAADCSGEHAGADVGGGGGLVAAAAAADDSDAAAVGGAVDRDRDVLQSSSKVHDTETLCATCVHDTQVLTSMLRTQRSQQVRGHAGCTTLRELRLRNLGALIAQLFRWWHCRFKRFQSAHPQKRPAS